MSADAILAMETLAEKVQRLVREEFWRPSWGDDTPLVSSPLSSKPSWPIFFIPMNVTTKSPITNSHSPCRFLLC